MAARPGEFTLTGWLDPVFDYFAKQADIPTADYTAVAGAEGIEHLSSSSRTSSLKACSTKPSISLLA
jgi:hypothetical protein